MTLASLFGLRSYLCCLYDVLSPRLPLSGDKDTLYPSAAFPMGGYRLVIQGVSPGSPDLSRPLAEREAVFLGQDQAQAQKESMN